MTTVWHEVPPRDYSHSSHSDVASSAQSQYLFATIDSHEQRSNIQDHNSDISSTSHEAKTNDEVSPKAKMAFPCVLYQMLQEADDKRYEAIVSWVYQGRAFRVHNTKRFVCSILPKYFAQTKFTSFQRQLNMYCFIRITKGRHKGAYCHHHFVRGEPQLCDKIVRMPFKGKKGKACSTNKRYPNLKTSIPLEPFMTRQEPNQSKLNSDTYMIHSEQAMWHEPQQPALYKGTKMVNSMYAWPTQSLTGDQMENLKILRGSTYPIIYGNAEMDHTELVALHRTQVPVQYPDTKMEDSKQAWGTHTMNSMDTSTMIRKPNSAIIHSYTKKSNAEHLTTREALQNPVQYHGAKLSESTYARGESCMEIATKEQEPVNMTIHKNSDLHNLWHIMLQDPLLSVQYLDSKTEDSISAWSTPCTGIASQVQRMNDRQYSDLPITCHYHDTETKTPTPYQFLSYSISKEDEVSSFCSADW